RHTSAVNHDHANFQFFNFQFFLVHPTGGKRITRRFAVNRLGAAIVGTGFIAPVHVEALRRLGRPVIGILGSSSEKSRAAAKALDIPKAYHSYEDLLADQDVGVVHVASPNRLHAEQCRLALAAGKHVVCEKPLAMTAAETT